MDSHDWTLGWVVIGFAAGAVVAFAVAVMSVLRRFGHRWLGLIGAALTLAGTVAATWVYAAHEPEPSCRFGPCVSVRPPPAARLVVIALWIATGLVAGLAVQGWRQRRRPPLIEEQYRRPPFP